MLICLTKEIAVVQSSYVAGRLEFAQNETKAKLTESEFFNNAWHANKKWQLIRRQGVHACVRYNTVTSKQPLGVQDKLCGE